MFRHMLPNAMVATLTLLPFMMTGRSAVLAGAGFLGLWLAVVGAVVGRADLAGETEPSGTVAGLHGVLYLCDHAVAACVHL